MVLIILQLRKTRVASLVPRSMEKFNYASHQVVLTNLTLTLGTVSLTKIYGQDRT